MPKTLEKAERRLGEKLFLKGDRCVGPKCAAIRRSYPPGIHGKARGRGRGLSEYAELLREKQKVRFFYSLDDGQVKRYADMASGEKGVFGDNFLRLLERRLDVTVWRLGFTASRRTARQAINHGHIAVNGRKVRACSYAVKKGDVIGISERALKSGLFQSLQDRLRGAQPALWLSLDRDNLQGIVSGLPSVEELGSSFDVTKVKEFYSR